MAMNIRNTISNDGGLRTVLPREGLDIGPAPDFWGDLDKIKTRLKPRANEQSQALRNPPADYSDRPMGPAQPEYDYEPTYATMQGGGFNMPGTSLNPWEPGMPYSMGNAPVQTGTRRVRRPSGRGGQVIDR